MEEECGSPPDSLQVKHRPTKLVKELNEPKKSG